LYLSVNTLNNNNIQQSGWLSSKLDFKVNICELRKRANNVAEDLLTYSFPSF